MEDYHLAAGAATNWGKTEGLRLGSLRGALPGAVVHAPGVGALSRIRWLDIDSDAVHAGCTAQVWGLPDRPQINLKPCVVLADGGGGRWEVEVGGNRFTVATAHLRVTATRFLGPWLGAHCWTTSASAACIARPKKVRRLGSNQYTTQP